MIPAQDSMPKGGLGNLIALPLQGRALKDGNSAFIDENWNAYSNQWNILWSKPKLSQVFIEEKIKEKFQASRQITIGSLRLDLSDGHAYLNNADRGLTRTEFSLLRLLAENQE